jgi:hypothetical protein
MRSTTPAASTPGWMLFAPAVGLVVLVTRYDGIDLPGDACRVLALDGLPETYGAVDRLEALALEDVKPWSAGGCSGSSRGWAEEYVPTMIIASCC